MRTAIRAATVAVFGMGVLASSFVSANDRTRVRELKGSSLSLHVASLEPGSGLQRMALPDGTALYVTPRPNWNAVDVLSANDQGAGLNLRLSGDATNRMISLLGGSASARLAVLVDGGLVSAATIGRDGMIQIDGLSIENADRITRLVRGDRPTVAGPRFSAVYAGESNGLHKVDIYVEGASDLRSYQVMLLIGGGESGRLELADVKIHQDRSDFVFNGVEFVPVEGVVNGRLGAVTWTESVDAPGQAYLGTYSFRASSDAQGVFRIAIDVGMETILGNSNSEEMSYSAGPDARIVVGTITKGDRK